jgi:S-adenosylmethionine:tRNA ribosyltransferase-isomerase
MSIKTKYTLSDFDYHLPESLIAQHPAEPRDHSRLLVFDRTTGKITDSYFYNLLDFLHPSTTLVMNNSRVEKARMLFEKIEVFVVRTINPDTVEAMVRPGKKFKFGKTISLTPEITAEVLHIADDGLRTLKFNHSIDLPLFEPYKQTPFPPYIKPDETLAERYQTVYSKPEGSKAAPTAGLHFTHELIQKLETASVDRAEVTLHVGLGTFAPVKSEDIEGHHLHSETWIVGELAAQKINDAHHVTAVGTTSARVLESLPYERGAVRAGSGATDIFIKPGYSFKMTDNLITNFHLPKSTLLMMVAALMGYEEMRHVYKHAIKEEYRFYSFGDAMLIL